jgi:nitrite reductase/ring-hydroxylating ferredoxin subunit
VETKPTVSGPLAHALRWVLPAVYLAVLIAPAYAFFSGRGGVGFLAGADLPAFANKIFPLVGLYAFTLVWLQFMLGSSMGPLKRVYPWIKTFHRWEGAFALLFALTHPLLLVLAVGIQHYVARDYVTPNLVPFIWIGYVQLFLIIVTAGTALLAKIPWLRARWHFIHYANYAVFVLVWVHSWFLGSDVRPTNLKYLWFFFALTAMLSAAARVTRLRRKHEAAVLAAGSFVTVALAERVAEGGALCVTVRGTAIALFNVSGKFYALANACVHEGGPLCEGQVVGNTVICPLHRSRFDVTTGAVVRGPADRPQPSFPVRVVNGEVQVRVESSEVLAGAL